MVYYAISPDVTHMVGVFADESGHQINRIATVTDTSMGSELQSLQPASTSLIPLTLSTDGKNLYGLLAYAAHNGLSHWVRIDTATGTIQHQLKVPVSAKYQKVTPDGTTILTVNSQGQAALTNTITRKIVSVKQAVCNHSYMCGLSSDGTVIYGAHVDSLKLTATDTIANTVRTRVHSAARTDIRRVSATDTNDGDKSLSGLGV